MPQFRVIAEKLWHSGECKHYHKGDVVTLPEGTVVKEGGSIELIEPKAPARAPAAKTAKPAGEATKPPGEAGDQPAGDATPLA